MHLTIGQIDYELTTVIPVIVTTSSTLRKFVLIIDLEFIILFKFQINNILRIKEIKNLNQYISHFIFCFIIYNCDINPLRLIEIRSISFNM